MAFGQTYKYRRKRTNRKTRRKQRGGNPKFVGKGSYGCVYRPAFPCAPPPPLGPYASPEDVAVRNALIRSRKIHAGKIGKLTTAREAAKEMTISGVLKIVDPEQSVLLYGLDSCQINPAETRLPSGVNYTPEMRRCIEGSRNPLNDTTPETAVQVFMKYGGDDMVNLDSSLAVDAPAVLESMVRLFDGLRLMHSRHLVHMDFKLQNTVLRRESGIYKPYIIDFGLIRQINRVYMGYIDWGKHVYAPYPPEISLLDIRLISKTARLIKTPSLAPSASAAAAGISGLTLETPKSAIINNFIDVFLKTKFGPELESSAQYGFKKTGLTYLAIRKPDASSLIDAAYLEYMRDLTNFLFVASNTSEAAADLRAWLDIDYDHLRGWFNRFNGAAPEPDDPTRFVVTKAYPIVFSFFNKFLKGIDAYSLGLVLAGVVFQMFGIQYHIARDGIGLVLYDKTHRHVSPETVHPDILKFTSEFYVNVVGPLDKIICSLMNFKFTKRATISEARAQYIALLPTIRKWCSKPAYEDMLVVMKIVDPVIPFSNSP